MYADDTFIVDIEAATAEKVMQAIGRAGACYGLSFNWRKLEALPVRTEAKIQTPDGTFVKEKH